MGMRALPAAKGLANGIRGACSEERGLLGPSALTHSAGHSREEDSAQKTRDCGDEKS